MSKEEMVSKKETTYCKILDASWEIAMNEGLESLSIRKVATALNFAPNNLYNYFKNKNELLYQLKKDAYEWTFKCVFNDLDISDTIEAFLSAISYKLLHVALKEPKRYIVMTSDLIMDSQEPLDKKINDYVADLLEKGISNENFRDINTQITATNIRISLIALVRWISSQENMSLSMADNYLKNYLTLLFNGLKA